MKFSKIIFIISIIGILSLLLLAQSTTKNLTGKINKITYSSNKITIQIEGLDMPLILFEDKPLNLKKGNLIKFQGTEELYKKNKQFLVTKIEIIGLPS